MIQHIKHKYVIYVMRFALSAPPTLGLGVVIQPSRELSCLENSFMKLQVATWESKLLTIDNLRHTEAKAADAICLSFLENPRKVSAGS